MPPKSRTIFWTTTPGSPQMILTVCLPGRSMCSVFFFTAQFFSTFSYQACAYSNEEVVGFITGPSSIATPYLDTFEEGAWGNGRAALRGKVGRM